ncbi:uncharacterized protein METZ01_LOCUS59705, partial [marine metagenome]
GRGKFGTRRQSFVGLQIIDYGASM